MPRKRTREASPRFLARFSSRARSGPSPAISSDARRVAPNRASASISTAKFFCFTRRPIAPKHVSPGAPGSGARGTKDTGL